MARAATEAELAKLRSDGQKTDLFLTIHKPETVYTALVNQSTFYDPVVQVNYDNGSGTLSDVKSGMTMYVGTEAGAYDLGMVRIRKTPTGTIFYVNEDSKIQWVNNAYLTIVDEFGLWQKHLVQDGSTVYMDYDIAYDDQHADLNPVPVLGPPAVLWLTGSTVDFNPNASDSWVLGSTISSYTWLAPGASATSGLSTATPMITYNAAGIYRVSCLITAANGKTTTGYRYIFVYDSDNLPVTQFELIDAPTGDFDDGGWEFSVRMFSEADDVRDRAMVILHARDWYGSEEGSIGPIEGYENIVAMGWIAGENIHQDPEYSYVDFDVRGPNYWLNKIPGYPVGVEYSSSDPTVWTSMKNLTVDRGLFHLLYWRSTAANMMDITLTVDTQYAPSAEASNGSLWIQITTIAEEMILAKPFCDRFGRLTVQVDTQYLASGDRSAIPTVMTLTQNDLREAVDWERDIVDQVAQVEASGISYDGSTATPLISNAPGTTYSRFGELISIEQLLVDDQDRLNEIAGMHLAKENNPYKHIDILLSANNRLIDVFPRQYLVMSVGATDTVRGIVLVNQKMLPRRVRLNYDADAGYMVVDLTCEAETIGVAGKTVPYTPPPETSILTYDLNDLKMPSFGGLGHSIQPEYTPEDEEPTGGDCPTDAPANGPWAVPLAGWIANNDKYYLSGGIWKYGRPSGHDYPTSYKMYCRVEKYVSGEWQETTDDSFYDVIAYDKNGDAVATGVHDAVTNPRQRTGSLTPSAVTAFRSVAVRIKDAYLFRPSGSVTVSATSSAEVTSTQVGFSKGSYKGGYYISSVYDFDWDSSPGHRMDLTIWVKAGDSSPLGTYTGRSIVTGLQTDSYSAMLDELFLHRYTGALSWESLWDDSASPPVKIMTSEDTWTTGNNVYPWFLAGLDGWWQGGSGVQHFRLSMQLWVYGAPTYRIHIGQLRLYNMCPV